MKHNLSVTLIIIGLFFLSHLIGLFLVDISNPVEIITNENGEQKTIRESMNIPGIGEQQPMGWVTVIPISIGILIGTAIMLLLIKYRLFRFMRGWHFVGIAACLFFAFFPLITFFLNFLSREIIILICLSVAVSLSALRLYKPNIFVHNFSELFIYGGISVVFASLFKSLDLTSASLAGVSILLIIISIYDAIAVWQSKHMIKLANAQTEQKIFAGIFIPYKRKEESGVDPSKIIYGRHMAEKKLPSNKTKDKISKKSSLKEENSNLTQTITVNETQKSAILGGGDIAFTLLFSSVVLLASYSFLKASIVSLTATVALALLLFFAKKDKFYPAMPFLSAGCFIGYAITLLF